MRRSRIKAMATVPARRKTNRDVSGEVSDSPNIISNDGSDKQKATEIIDDSKKTPNEDSKLPIENQETGENRQRPSTVSETVEILTSEPTDTEDVAAISRDSGHTTVENSDQQNQVSATISEQPENIAEESSVRQKTILGRENVPSGDETKNSPRIDAPPVTKVSQTRTSFMRPTPRLDGGGRIRRNSVQGSGASAGESEDDTRRTTNSMANRNRNDSVSSMQSPKGTAPRDTSTPSVPANSLLSNNTGNTKNGTSPANNSSRASAKQARKRIVSESARKLAESRRDFFMKYEHKQPDRAKLTMYDLIYYNPLTNPMKKPDGSLTGTQKSSSSVVMPEPEVDEDEDCDIGEAMPVPQVKVGPDGHLIIDEQSLVIEHTGAKKSRQALARTEALVDEENNGSGFYKKRKKTKDWSQWETLKFYKALNNVGTDFLLMQSLFPTRSRHEIKMKFKKEERTNHRFVEKALTYQEFDIESLREDLATFEETENKRCDSAKSDKSPARQGGGTKRPRGKSRRMAARSIDESNEIDETNVPDADKTTDDSGCQESTVKEEKRVSERQTVPSDSCSRTESTSSSNESSSDTEIYRVRPTRSGRLPKVRKLQAPTINTLDNLFSDPEQDIEQPSSPKSSSIDDDEPDDLLPNLTNDEETFFDETENTVFSSNSRCIENSVTDISHVEPGSLVIVSCESTDQPGEKVLQVYMVSSDIDESSGNGTKRNMTPVVLTPELLNTVTAGITKVDPVDVNTD